MKSSFCASCGKQLVRVAQAAMLLWSCGVSLSAIALECNTSPVFAFSRALYLQQYQDSQVWLELIEAERSPGLAQFMHQVLDFKRAYDLSDREMQKDALENVDALIAALRVENNSGQNLSAARDLPNIVLHAARMHLLAGNLLRAARLGKEAGALLQKRADELQRNSNDLLALGLYHYYAGRGDDDLGWLISLFGFNGDKQQGIELIKQAVTESPDYAFEASRTLLSDIAWNRQQTCPYLPYFDSMTTVDILISDHYQQQISGFLFCGAPLYALDLIADFEMGMEQDGQELSLVQQDWLFDAKLYALAALGEIKGLKELLPESATLDSEREYKIRFSLAKAHDVLGQHELSSRLYEQVLALVSDSPYRQLTLIYRQSPYRPPVAFNWQDISQPSLACADR